LSADTTHTGNPIWLRSFILESKNPVFYYLGLKNEETEFSVYLKDRWGNRTDAKIFTRTPMFEEELDKNLWRKYTLPSDKFDHYEHFRFEMLWDKMNSPDNHFWLSLRVLLPVTFTIDLGQSVKLSRFVMYHAYNEPYTTYRVPKKMELWVSDLYAPGDDLFGGDWQLIARLESTTFSGQETATDEDKLRAIWEGENMFIEPTDEIADPYVSFRFLRIRVLQMWDKDVTDPHICIGEIDHFGQAIK